jgi:REP-associated tyrosine transposase
MFYYERNLPHWHPEGRPIFLTWRLHGSLPNHRTFRPPAPKGSPGKRFLEMDRKLDTTRVGPRWLSDPDVANIVEAAIRRGAALDHYLLHAYVVMPNHVHLLIEPRLPLPRITQTIKGLSARTANLHLKRIGEPFWQDETFDHWIRNEAEFTRVHRYIEHNPVKAALANRAGDWRWSSASHP